MAGCHQQGRRPQQQKGVNQQEIGQRRTPASGLDAGAESFGCGVEGQEGNVADRNGQGPTG